MGPEFDPIVAQGHFPLDFKHYPPQYMPYIYASSRLAVLNFRAIQSGHCGIKNTPSRTQNCPVATVWNMVDHDVCLF